MHAEREVLIYPGQVVDTKHVRIVSDSYNARTEPLVVMPPQPEALAPEQAPPIERVNPFLMATPKILETVIGAESAADLPALFGANEIPLNYRDVWLAELKNSAKEVIAARDAKDRQDSSYAQFEVLNRPNNDATTIPESTILAATVELPAEVTQPVKIEVDPLAALDLSDDEILDLRYEARRNGTVLDTYSPAERNAIIAAYEKLESDIHAICDKLPYDKIVETLNKSRHWSMGKRDLVERRLQMAEQKAQDYKNMPPVTLIKLLGAGAEGSMPRWERDSFQSCASDALVRMHKWINALNPDALTVEHDSMKRGDLPIYEAAIDARFKEVMAGRAEQQQAEPTKNAVPEQRPAAEPQPAAEEAKANETASTPEKAKEPRSVAEILKEMAQQEIALIGSDGLDPLTMSKKQIESLTDAQLNYLVDYATGPDSYTRMEREYRALKAKLDKGLTGNKKTEIEKRMEKLDKDASAIVNKNDSRMTKSQFKAFDSEKTKRETARIEVDEVLKSLKAYADYKYATKTKVKVTTEKGKTKEKTERKKDPAIYGQLVLGIAQVETSIFRKDPNTRFDPWKFNGRQQRASDAILLERMNAKNVFESQDLATRMWNRLTTSEGQAKFLAIEKEYKDTPW